MKVFNIVVVILTFGVVSYANPTGEHVADAKIDNELPVVTTEISTKECLQSGDAERTLSCITTLALTKLEDVTSQQTINILPGVELTSDEPTSQRSMQPRTLELPKTLEDRISKNFDMMFHIIENLFSGRTLRIKVPESASKNVLRSLEEGRGKMKKLMKPLMMGLGAKLIAVVPLLLGGLAILVKKALIVAKLALIVTVIVGFQYFSSVGSGFLGKFGSAMSNIGGHGHGGGGSYGHGGHGGWSTGGAQYYPYARSVDEDVQNVVYSAQKP